MNLNLQYVASCDQMLNICLGFCATFATLRFIKLFRFVKRIFIFMYAFQKSLVELTSMSFIFVIVWIAFAQTFYFLLNDQSDGFRSPIAAMTTCFQIMLGKFEANTFYQRNQILNPFLFALFNIVAIFVLLNLLVSILVDYFEQAKTSQELDENDPHFFEFLCSLICFWKKEKQQEPKYLEFSDSFVNDMKMLLVRFQKVKFSTKITK